MVHLLKADLHTHTIGSIHGLNTLEEMVREASRRKIKILGITEHGPASYMDSHQQENRLDIHERVDTERLYKEYGVKVYPGCELNVIFKNGEYDVDLMRGILRKQRMTCVGFHSCSPNDSETDNALGLAHIINTYPIHFVSHLYLAKIDIELAVFEIYKTSNTLFEVNVSTVRYKFNKVTIQKMRKMIDAVKSYGGKLLVNTDSHTKYEIGDDIFLEPHYQELGLTEDDIINNDPGGLIKYIESKNKALKSL